MKLVNKSSLLVESALTATSCVGDKMAEMVRFLLSLSGIDLNVRSFYNRHENLITALIRRRGDDCVDIIRLILKVGLEQIYLIILRGLLINKHDYNSLLASVGWKQPLNISNDLEKHYYKRKKTVS